MADKGKRKYRFLYGRGDGLDFGEMEETKAIELAREKAIGAKDPKAQLIVIGGDGVVWSASSIPESCFRTSKRG